MLLNFGKKREAESETERKVEEVEKKKKGGPRRAKTEKKEKPFFFLFTETFSYLALFRAHRHGHDLLRVAGFFQTERLLEVYY